MLRPGLLLALCLGGPGIAGCRVPQPTPEDWQAIGFRTPEQTFHTFLTALAADQADLEYRSFSVGFRRRGLGTGPVTQLGYRVFRDELAHEEPWFRHVARARVVSSRPLEDGRQRLEAEVSFLWSHWRFAVDLVREDYWELWVGDERVDDAAASFDEHVAVAGTLGGERELEVRVPLNDWVEPERLGEVRVGREWKIDDFRELDDDDPEP